MHEDKRSFKCIVYVLISRVCNRPEEENSDIKVFSFYFAHIF